MKSLISNKKTLAFIILTGSVLVTLGAFLRIMYGHDPRLPMLANALMIAGVIGSNGGILLLLIAITRKA